jgi:tRNA A-37 threonylcarbamoyl transferase component Bud32
MTPAYGKKILLAPDSHLPQRETLLDSAEMNRRFAFYLRETVAAENNLCAIERVKYRFGENLRVLYKLRRGNRSLPIAARTFPVKRGREVYDTYLQNAAHDSKLQPVWFDEELQTIFWTFPHDRKISNLDDLTKIPESLRNFSGKFYWTTSRLVAYAPEKCATAECLDGAGEVKAYAKVFAGDEGRGIYSIYNYFKENGVSVPHALIYSENSRTLILEAIAGTRVADLKAENLNEVYRKLGAAIASLHQIAPPADLPRFKRLRPERLPQILETIKRARPDLAPQARRLAQKLAETFEFSGEREVCLHGDVHAKNAVRQRSGKLTLIDLDQVSIGRAACDIGSFLAGLYYKTCAGELSARKSKEIAESFLSGYAQICALPSEKSLGWHTATALFAERAARSISRVRIDGLNHLGEILALSEKILNLK